MQNEVLFAVSKLIGAKDNFTVGDHNVKGVVTFEVDAVVSRAPDTSAKPTTHLLCKKTIAQFLARMGATQNAALDALEATWDALLTGETLELDPKMQDRLDIALAKFERMTEKLPKSPKKGGTTVRGSLKILDNVKDAA